MFEGWYTADGTLYEFNTPVTESFTLTAHWTGNSNLLKGQWRAEESGIVYILDIRHTESECWIVGKLEGESNIANKIMPPIISNRSEAGDGWFVVSYGPEDSQVEIKYRFKDGDTDTLEVNIVGDRSMTFSRVPDGKTVEFRNLVTFDLNEPEGEASFDIEDSKKNVDDGDTLGTIPQPTLDGYEFIGWYTVAEDQNDGNRFDIENDPVNDDMTLYAGWISDNFHSVTIDYGEYLGTKTIFVEEGNIVPTGQRNPSGSLSLCNGWFTDSGHTKSFDIDNTPITKDITLYPSYSWINLTLEGRDTYLVWDWVGLDMLSNALEYNQSPDFILLANIELTEPWNVAGMSYAGIFDGRGHTISIAEISGSGFFNEIEGGASIKNLTLEVASVESNNDEAGAGAFAYSNSGTITNCRAIINGDISVTSSLGGIVGWNKGNGRIEGCSSIIRGKMTSDSYVGGISGRNEGRIAASYMILGEDGSLLSTNSYCGGITASNQTGSVAGCYAVINGSNSLQYAIANGGNLSACYWQSSDENFEDNTPNVIEVTTTEEWADAMSAMNTAITDTGYQFKENEGDGAGTIPLVIVSTST